MDPDDIRKALLKVALALSDHKLASLRQCEIDEATAQYLAENDFVDMVKDTPKPGAPSPDPLDHFLIINLTHHGETFLKSK